MGWCMYDGVNYNASDSAIDVWCMMRWSDMMTHGVINLCI